MSGRDRESDLRQRIRGPSLRRARGVGPTRADDNPQTQLPAKAALLVTDSAGTYATFQALLSRFDMPRLRLLWAGGWQAALATLSDQHPDVCLLDLGLSNERLGFIEEAKRSGVIAPIVALLQRRDRTIEEKVMSAGAADWLVKTGLEPETLERTLRYVLERSRLMQALRETQRRWRAVFEYSPDGVLIVDDDAKVVEANQNAQKLLGGRAVPGAALFDLFGKQSATFASLWSRILEEGRSSGELEIASAAGTKFLEFSARAHVDAQKNLILLRASRAEEAQLAHAAVFSSAPDAMVALDREGRVQHWNAAAERLLGHSSHQVHRTDFASLFVEDAAVRDVCAAVAGGEASRRITARARTAAGPLRDVSLAVSAIGRAGGGALGFVVLMQDGQPIAVNA